MTWYRLTFRVDVHTPDDPESEWPGGQVPDLADWPRSLVKELTMSASEHLHGSLQAGEWLQPTGITVVDL